MPHLEAEPPLVVGKNKIQFVDLQIEKYPMSKEQKDELFGEFSKNGLVGDFFGVKIHFKPDYTISVAKNVDNVKVLPKGWEKHMKFVSEAKQATFKIPTLVEVFTKGA